MRYLLLVQPSGNLPAYNPNRRNIPVYGSHLSPVKQISHRLHENDEITCAGLRFKILEIPGNTLAHIAYCADGILFCGDTLFSAGCGRVFEGTHEQMVTSLAKMTRLDDETHIYCGHEYTLANLQFAQHVEPNNQFILKKIEEVKNVSCSLPSVLRDEKNINPFLRCDVVDVISAAEKQAKKKLNNAVEVFACLREWKNGFQA